MRNDEGIAIVGLAGRFPGARDVAAFWRNLCAGVESLTAFAESDLEDAFGTDERRAADFVRARGVLEDADRFDAGFFGMHAREAELTDPQHRVLLETCWEALEDAGVDPARYPGAAGIYAGCSISTYFLRNVLAERKAVDAFASAYQVGGFPELIGSGADFLATRVAYKLDLRGPAMTVQSACSTSLLAVAQACQTLWLGQADLMLAGAVSISFPQRRGYRYQDGGMVSKDGHCRTFDAASSGTVFGAGAGVVVLKRASDARRDGDAIYAVIRGTGVTNDGSAKVGYSAPGIEAQAAAVSAAQCMAGFAPETIDYIECHGTATALGDPIEVAALAQAFGAVEPGTRCALGSVKPNVGHLDVAAGMAGLIKTALALRQAKIPATLHFTAPNPHIDFSATPFYVNASLADWPATQRTRRAGVSAFGVGGTNVHLVLESDPAPRETGAQAGPHLLPLSGRDERALGESAARLAEHLRAHLDIALGDVAFTLQTGRRAFAQRRFVVAATHEEACAKLEAAERRGRASGADGRVAFLFPGQGAQFPGMGRELYATQPAFREALERCLEIAQPLLQTDLRALLGAGSDDADAAQALKQTAVAQPALFAVEYALAQLWAGFGVRPAAMLGHSVGEFVAATLAGVFDLETALRIVVERGRLMQALPGGAMLAVRLAEGEVRDLLREAKRATPAVAALNAPRQAVVAGSFADIAVVEGLLEARGAIFRRLDSSHAFHSPMMEAVRAPLADFIGTVRLAPPTLPYVSSMTGNWIEDAQATSPAYWAAHALEPVRFGDALETLVAAGIGCLLEIGPGTALASAARQGAGAAAGCAIASSLVVANDEWRCVLEAAGALWSAGCVPDWRALHGEASPRRISLPTYPFARTRYWIEPNASVTEEAAAVNETDSKQSSSAGTQPVARELAALLEELSGERIGAEHLGTSFLELGFDSLFLGRFVQQLNAKFGVRVTFRQLLGELPSLEALAARVAAAVPQRAAAVPEPSVAVHEPSHAQPASALEAVVREQLAAMQQLMREQLAVLGGTVQTPAQPVVAPAAAPVVPAPETAARFDAFRVKASGGGELTPAQRAHVDALVARVTARTPASKAYAQRYRAVLADPRVAAGFRAEWKEMVYPIVCDRAAGAKLWDIDGNEYVDVLNGFGQTAFGHGPDFVVDAVAERLQRGFAIGPQTDLAGEVAALFCALTGNERMTFCNTGSEAVMAALRVARTVTGRNRVVLFDGAYHGQFDEVLVKSARTSQRAIAVAPGIPPEAVANVTVLEYGSAESLAWIRAHAGELAAVVVEPVQSRRPALAPKAFLHELREITAASGTALVFDEVVTGFRMHPGGMQAVFGVRADLATYGKVVGGGLPIGILAGASRFMDALDGGMWQYGDASAPEVPPTFFAGTFVRHPLAMAAVLSVLRHVEAQGPALQEALAARTAALVRSLNADLERRGIASRIDAYGSLFYVNFAHEEKLAGLLYYHLRARGVYIQEGFPCFLTTAHTDADLAHVARAFAESFDELQAAGIFRSGEVAPLAAAAPPLQIPLTEEQTEIWLAAQLGDEASCAFNESITLRLRGPFDAAAFGRALDGVVARHEALRASYGLTGEAMRIAPAVHVPLESGSGSLEEFVALDARTPFDLADGPLVRARYFRQAGEDHAVVLTAHHLACDGWSMNVVLAELAELYAAEVRGVVAQLPEPLAFSAYARRTACAEPAAAAAVENFWREQFARPVPPLDLPTDRPRPAQRTFAGATRSIALDAQRAAALKRAGARHGCTLFVTLLAAFDALIGRLAQCDEVVVGIPAAGQALLDDEILVGHCVDFLPIRSSWNPQAPFSELLGTVRQRVLDAYEHQEYTLGTLVRALAYPRAADRVPLAEIQFNLERVAEGLHLPGLDVTVEPNPKAFVNFDLFFNAIESGDGLRVDCDFNTALFDAASIERWLEAYARLLDAVAADQAASVAALTAFAGEQPVRERSAVDGPANDYRRGATVHDLVAAQARRRPGARAVVYGDESLSYAELERRANRLANHLLTRTGGAGKLVGIALDRSAGMLVALLAVLKAGCAYVPLDPKHPSARLAHILNDAGVAALILDGEGAPTFVPDGVAVVDLTRDSAAIAAARDAAPAARDAGSLAYVIYTSGSTGLPKGVEIEHRAVVNLLEAMARRPGLAADDVFLALTTIAFDIAALELYLPLVTGACVVIARSDEAADGNALLRLLQTSGATSLQATPATWRLLLEAGFRAAPGLRMLCGGEALRPDLAARLLAGEGELWNMYGPTETTIWSSCARIESAAEITAGMPIANTQVYVLDERDRLTARGEAGQLHIAGDGLARGYHGQPALTAEKFVPNPFGPGRLYRTGDSARITTTGQIEILGRIDHQVKLRGFRIELGEIETALAQTGALAACAVALREDVADQPRLTAYYVEKPGAPVATADLYAALALRLPAYMLPTAWVRLDALPLTPNGKLDRSALPAPGLPAPQAGREAAAPLTATERALARICEEVLRLDRVCAGDDLFALGADSIQLFQITARANRDGMRIAAKQLFAHRTIGALARHLDLAAAP